MNLGVYNCIYNFRKIRRDIKLYPTVVLLLYILLPTVIHKADTIIEIYALFHSNFRMQLHLDKDEKHYASIRIEGSRNVTGA